MSAVEVSVVSNLCLVFLLHSFSLPDGGTYFFLKIICPDRLNITSTAVDTSNEEALRAAIEDAERLDAIFIETPSNPTLSITDIALAGQLARAKNPSCLVIVDNTFLGPVFQSPFVHGADLVLYSATKFIGGQSDLLCGLALTKSEDFIHKINGYRTILGPVISADTAWLVTRSVETLWLRMERQAEKAEKVAAALAYVCRFLVVVAAAFACPTRSL